MLTSRLRWLLLTASLVFLPLAAWAGEPTLQNVQSSGSSNKIKKVILLYQEKNFVMKEQYAGFRTNTNARTFLGDTGFLQFGDVLVVNAGQSLSSAGIIVVHSGSAAENQLAAYVKELPDLLGEQMRESCYITIVPVRASTAGNNLGFSSIEVDFLVRMSDVTSGKSVWMGTVATTTRIGKGAIAGALMAPQIYDKAYAETIFQLLIDSWRKSGII